MIKPFNEVYKLDSITLNVTNNCNLSCSYCFEHNKSTHRDMMDPKDAVEIIKTAYSSHYVNPKFGSFTINFFGGEPFLNWEAMKAIVDYCSENKLEVNYGITTNLTILTDEMIDYVDKYNLHLLVSIDGTKEIHDKNRSNSFDKVYHNLQRLKERDLLIYVEARMTILPEDAASMFQSVKFLIDFGIDNICPMPVTDVEWTDEELINYKLNFGAMVDYFVVKSNEEDYHRNISIKNVNDMLTNVLSPDVSDDMLCSIFSNRWCAIDTNGDVYPCHQLPTSTPEIKAKNKIGNVFTGVEEDMLLKEPRKVSYHKEECDTCNAKGTCKGGCPQENYRLNNRDDEPSEAYCMLHRIMSEVIMRMQNTILSMKHLRGRQLVLLKENLKIKDYIDFIFNNTDLRDTLVASTRLTKVKEMIDNLGEEKILPTFKDYFQQKLVIIGAVILVENKTRKEELLNSED